MKKNTLGIIIILITISVVGIIFTQTFWIKRSWNIAQQQFDHRVDEALNDVLAELKDYTDSTFRAMHKFPAFESIKTGTIFDVLDTVILDTLIRKYTAYHMLDNNYYYGIVKTADDSVVYSSPGYFTARKRCTLYRACLSCIWKKEYFHISLCYPTRNKQILLGLSVWLFWSVLFVVIVIFSFVYVLFTIIHQKKLSDMKNDFINNMTHEFKTPISTISLASEVLLNSGTATSFERIKKYSKIIYDENLRMRSQVDRVLNMAMQNKGEIRLNKAEVDIHDLIQNTVENLLFDPDEKKINVHYHLRAKDHILNADIMHITNIVSNIVDNAIKYSGDNPSITIYTENINDGILISFSDNGIGMSKDQQKQIFEKFYRVPTGNVHNVKGFGLGLYYVKTMVESHGGYVNVHSELNKGSRFDVYLPKNDHQ